VRVLFLTPGWPPAQNGVGDYTHSLSAELVKRGIEVSVLTPSKLHFMGRRLAATSSVIGAGPRWDWPLLFALAPKIENLNPDLIHLQYEGFGFHQSFILPYFLRLLKAPKVTTLHEVWFKSDVHRWRDKKICECSKAIIVNDEGCLRRYRQLGTSAEVFKIGVGSNIPVLNTTFQEIDQGPIWIGYFGFFNLIKRVNYLLEALKEIRLKTRRDFRLRMVGEFIPDKISYHRDLLNLRDQLGLTDVATFSGAVSGLEASTLLAGCHLAVLPFIDGASPRRGSFQALASLGVPIITTKGPDEETDIRHGETALYIDRLSVSDISTAILRLVEDRTLRVRLREGGLSFHQNFSWSTIADRHVEIYRHVEASQ
jgi:glycosyltransferase involved in cell wall biosynthesis